MPIGRKTLYRLTPGEQAIFARARADNDPNWLTNYYMRSETTGTYWRSVLDYDIGRLEIEQFRNAALRWQAGYEQLYELWETLGKPEYFYPEGNKWTSCSLGEFYVRSERLERVYRTISDPETGSVLFHHPHGALLLKWQLELFRATQPIDVIVGAFGSGKTWAKVLHMLCRAIMLPGYRGFVLAPYSIQANEVYTQALSIINNTYYEERFVLRTVTRPFTKIEIGHEGVGHNTIEFYPILDDPLKIRSLTGDEGMVDQVEQLPDIGELVRTLGTRLRGQYQGRPRLGKMTLIGNPADNPEMWDWFDDAFSAPEEIFSYAPTTHENTYLTVGDFLRFQRQVGHDPTSQAIYLFASRPMGSGKHFPATSLEKCKSEELDEYMNQGLSQENPGFRRIEAPRVGVWRWETPPIEEHEYLVAADPGWGNPPYRNSAVVGTWDITGYMSGAPARLVAFEWVFGQGSPNPWINKFTDYVLTYRAVGSCAYDGTGFQAGYEKLVHGLQQLLAEPINMGGQKKFAALNLAKKMFADGRYAIPSIPGVFTQLAKYDIPDNGLRQDIVSFILVTSVWLERLYYVNLYKGEEREDYDPYDRSWREGDRYPGRES